MDRYTYEREALAAGYGLVCGCDEAGAGPLAGPVYAAAVILPLGLDVPGLDDSKKLTAKKRESLFPFIQEQALACAVAWVDADEIDATDILSARMRAMQLAIDGLPVHPDFALIDGNRDRAMVTNPAKPFPYSPLSITSTRSPFSVSVAQAASSPKIPSPSRISVSFFV